MTWNSARPVVFRRLPQLIGITFAFVMLATALSLVAVERRLVEASGHTLALAASDIADKITLVLYERHANIRAFASAGEHFLAHRDFQGLQRFIVTRHDAFPVYHRIAVTDMEGRVVASTKDDRGTDVSGEVWFRSTRDSRRTEIRQTPPATAQSDWLLRFAAPIVSTDGRLLGVVTTELGLGALEELFPRTIRVFSKHSRTGAIDWNLLAYDGTVLTRSLYGAPTGSNFIGAGIPSASLSLDPDHQPGYIEEHDSTAGTDVITGYAHTTGHGGLNPHFGVLVHKDKQALISAIRLTLVKIASTVALIAFPLIALTLWISRRLACMNLEMETAVRERTHELQQSRDMLNLVINNTPQYVFWKDRHLKYLGCNTPFAEAAGLGDPAAIVGKTDFDLSWSETAELYRADDRLVMETRTPRLNFDEPLGNTDRVIRTSKVPLFDRKGEVFGVLGIFEDVTERKQVERELLQAQERLQLALKAGSAGLWSWNLKTNAVYISSTWKAQLGFGDEELSNTYEEFEGRVHPDDVDRVREKNRAYINNPAGDYEFELRLQHKDGSYRWMFCRAGVFNDADGLPMWFTGCNIDFTDRKENEARLINAQRIARLAYWDWDVVGGGLVWSEQLYALLGLDPKQFTPTYETFLQAVHPDDRHRVQQRVAECLSSHSSYSLDYRMIRTDGAVRVMHAEAEISCHENGQAVRMAGTIQDITERKMMEQALAASEERFQLAVRATNDSIWDWDLQTNMLWWDETSKAQYGYTANDIESSVEAWQSRIHPEDLPHVLDGIDEAVQHGRKSWSSEYRFRRSDGTYASIFDRGLIVRNESAEPVRMVGAMTDISQRKQAEEALRETNARLAALIDSSPVGITILDTEGRVRLWNPAAERIYGWSAAEVIGEPLPTVPPEEREHHRQICRRTMNGEIFTDHELVRKRKDGAKVNISLSTAPLVAADGQIMGVIGIMANITESKRIEENAIRMEQLALLGQLLAGIAHELKNPLFVITGRLQMLKEKLSQGRYDAAARDVEKIEHGAERMLQVTQRFLSLAKPDRRMRDRASVTAVLDQTLEFLSNELMEHQITVVKSYAPDVPNLLCDAKQLNGVFLNILMNAEYAMANAHGRGTLTVTVLHHDGWIETRIGDDGPGVSAEHLSKIFEPFFTTKPAGEGSGLGLWTVRMTVMAMHGTVACESEEGHGATFIVRLPVQWQPHKQKSEEEHVGSFIHSSVSHL